MAAHRALRTPWRRPSAHRIAISGFSFVILAAGAVGILMGRDGHVPAVQLAAASDRATHATRDLARPVSPAVTPTASPPGAPAATATTTATPNAARSAKPKVTKRPPKPAATVSPSCRKYSGSQRVACTLLPKYGFPTSEMPALVRMWTHESNWNHLAQNPSSGAYGIPQALPGNRMASVGSDWRTNPATQIRWGLSYIKERYGSPSQAWGFWQANGWY